MAHTADSITGEVIGKFDLYTNPMDLIRNSLSTILIFPSITFLVQRVFTEDFNHGRSIMQCVQEAVDVHVDLHNLHRECSTPRPQCTAPPLLIHTSKAVDTHKVWFSEIPLIIHQGAPQNRGSTGPVFCMSCLLRYSITEGTKIITLWYLEYPLGGSMDHPWILISIYTWNSRMRPLIQDWNIINIFWLCTPGGCQRRRRTSPGRGSRRRCPRCPSPRSFDTFFPPLDRSYFCAADSWDCNVSVHSVPVQAFFFGRLQRRHSTGAQILTK